FDWAVYGLSLLGGGIDSAVSQAILVVVKALLITGLAWVLLGQRRAGQSLWVPVLCTGLAMLTLSPGLYFRPVCVSFLLLGLTLYLLNKRGSRPAGQGA